MSSNLVVHKLYDEAMDQEFCQLSESVSFFKSTDYYRLFMQDWVDFVHALLFQISFEG